VIGLFSPNTGQELRPDGPSALTDGRERWPVVDGIPFLRTGREALVARCLDALDRGDADGALVALLADQDDWWDGPPPADDDLRRLVRARAELSLREAMGLLGFGRVGHYFAHRWSDPTFIAGLALLDAHWNAPRDAFELACGIGHYLRDLAGRGVSVTGGDVVFSKLWLAKHWVVPQARLICFDAAASWPLRGRQADLCLCHDALYFLEPKEHVVAGLRSLLRPGGALAIGHVHNRAAPNHSAGAGMSADELAAMFPAATFYDDADLTKAAAAGASPPARAPDDLRRVDAFALCEGAPARADTLPAPPHADEVPRLNPLYAPADGGHEVAWPSERYRDEYAQSATYRHRIEADPVPDEAALRRREFLHLPERW
jgi:SAM-dependent methyltransferase